jgi:nicotinamide riboside transporter PnuC
MDYIISIISVLVLWLTGNKSVWGMRLGLANQVLWFIYVIVTKQYGLLIGVIAFTIVYIRNLIKWEKEKKAKNELEF